MAANRRPLICGRAILVLTLSIVGLALFRPTAARAASLYLSPSTSTVTVGKNFSVTVKVNSGGQAINAAEATITFPTAVLDFQSVSTAGSIMKYWTVNPSGSDTTGRAVFSGGLPAPGYTGSSGTIIVLTWQAKATGKATVSITNGRVLANDGQGTDLLTSQGSGTYTLVAPVVSPTQPVPVLRSPTNPDQDQWYQANPAIIEWSQPAGIQGVSYGFNQEPTTVPDETLESNTGRASFELPRDGVWYFHLRAKYASGWSDVAHWRIGYDHTPPEPFTLELRRDRGVSDPSPEVLFTATDATSGISRYTLVLDDQPARDVTSPVSLTPTAAGLQRVTVTAYDRAGNSRQSELTFLSSGYPPPTITSVSTPLVLLELLVVRGRANAGDTVAINVDGQPIGQVIAGRATADSGDGVTVRLPWAFTSDQIFAPGRHAITAVATGAAGEVSVATDPVYVTVTGRSITIGGRVLATVAVVPIVGLVVIGLLVALVAVMGRLFASVVRLHRREEQVEEEVEELRHRVLKGDISNRQVESSLEDIAEDLTGQRAGQVGKKTKRRSPTRGKDR